MSDRERRIVASWERNAGAWTDAVRNGLIPSRILATNAAVLDAVAQVAPRSVLDVGCGEGWLANELAARGMTVVGFDGNEQLIEAARSGTASFRVLSYEEFVLSPEQVGSDYDLVLCNFSLLGENILPVLRGCRAATRDGTLIVQTVHPFADAETGAYEDGWREEDFSGMARPFPTPMPWYFRTMGTWLNLIVQAGFSVVAVREPLHPETRRPLSLLVVARAARPDGLR